MKVQRVRNAAEATDSKPGRLQVMFDARGADLAPERLVVDYTAGESVWMVGLKAAVAHCTERNLEIVGPPAVTILKSPKVGVSSDPGEVQITCTEEEALSIAVMFGKTNHTTVAKRLVTPSGAKRLRWENHPDMYQSLRNAGLGMGHPRYPVSGSITSDY